MMITIINTKTHKVLKHYPEAPRKHQMMPVLVTDGKLVLVECKPIEAKFGLTRPEFGSRLLPRLEWKVEAYKWLKPIIISETEEIVVGDWVFDTINNTIYRSMYEKGFKSLGVFKILALSEHFSPQQLQMIVNGKLSDGHKVVVECIETQEQYPIGGSYPLDFHIIKLNTLNHITLHQVDERLYTLKELKRIAYKVWLRGDLDFNQIFQLSLNEINSKKSNEDAVQD